MEFRIIHSSGLLPVVLMHHKGPSWKVLSAEESALKSWIWNDRSVVYMSTTVPVTATHCTTAHSSRHASKKHGATQLNSLKSCNDEAAPAWETEAELSKGRSACQQFKLCLVIPITIPSPVFLSVTMDTLGLIVWAGTCGSHVIDASHSFVSLFVRGKIVWLRACRISYCLPMSQCWRDR